MCGEHLAITVTLCLVAGIIPACAGSTGYVRKLRHSARDHPRMCGEHFGSAMQNSLRWGSSPHVRGAQSGYGDAARFAGIIPACAGSTLADINGDPAVRDHPRMCGEHLMPPVTAGLNRGSSPHVRGAPADRLRCRGDGGIIPACAGSTGWRFIIMFKVWDHPRMCGEHTESKSSEATSAGSSPHVRGALTFGGAAVRMVGIIPACAGSTGFALPFG